MATIVNFVWKEGSDTNLSNFFYSIVYSEHFHIGGIF